MAETFQVIGDEIFFDNHRIGFLDGPGWIVRRARDDIDSTVTQDILDAAVEAANQAGYEEGRAEPLDTSAANEELLIQLQDAKTAIEDRDVAIAALREKLHRLEGDLETVNMERLPFSYWLQLRLGTDKWAVSSRLTKGLKEQGFEVAISMAKHDALKSNYEFNPSRGAALALAAQERRKE